MKILQIPGIFRLISHELQCMSIQCQYKPTLPRLCIHIISDESIVVVISLAVIAYTIVHR